VTAFSVAEGLKPKVDRALDDALLTVPSADRRIPTVNLLLLRSPALA